MFYYEQWIPLNGMVSLLMLNSFVCSLPKACEISAERHVCHTEKEHTLHFVLANGVLRWSKVHTLMTVNIGADSCRRKCCATSSCFSPSAILFHYSHIHLPASNHQERFHRSLLYFFFSIFFLFFFNLFFWQNKTVSIAKCKGSYS